MKVFVSWSGPRSMAVAKILASWFPQIMNEVETFVSDDDIDKGTAWNATITAALNESSFGVICVTPENDSSSWMLFEAGAISKQVGHNTSKVAPLLIGFGEGLLAPGHPLGGYQVTKPSREDMRKLVGSMNASLDNPRDVASLDRAFEVWWPEFEREFAAIPNPTGTESPSAPTERDLLQELLISVKNMSGMLDRTTRAALEMPSNFPQFNAGDRILSPSEREIVDRHISKRQVIDNAADLYDIEVLSLTVSADRPAEIVVKTPKTDKENQNLSGFHRYIDKRGISFAVGLVD